ncbi:MAG: T9SS type A sorting domain-containing protein, partial [Bacteroidota bacterium]
GNTSGTWIIDIPVPSYTNPSAQTGLVQVGTQVTSGGQYCAVTGNASNASQSIGTADIDAGTTRLESPVFSLVGFTNPAITYYRSFSNNAGSNPGTDPWVAEISSDNGNSWSKVEHTYYSDVNWRRFAFKVLDYTTLTSQMKVRFTASDSTIASLPNNGQSVSEAAMDEFQVWDGPLSTGIEDQSVASAVIIFPNPATENAVIAFSFNSEQETSIEITNALGQVIWHKDLGILNAGSWSYTMDVRNFSAGMYQLHIKTPSGTVSRKLSVAR